MSGPELLRELEALDCPEACVGKGQYIPISRQFLRRILTALRTPSQGWQPIETAPKDGSEIDLWANGRRRANCRWGVFRWHNGKPQDEPCWGPYMMGEEGPLQPTHWQPLPTPPEKL